MSLIINSYTQANIQANTGKIFLQVVREELKANNGQPTLRATENFNRAKKQAALIKEMMKDDSNLNLPDLVKNFLLDFGNLREEYLGGGISITTTISHHQTTPSNHLQPKSGLDIRLSSIPSLVNCVGFYTKQNNINEATNHALEIIRIINQALKLELSQTHKNQLISGIRSLDNIHNSELKSRISGPLNELIQSIPELLQCGF